MECYACGRWMEWDDELNAYECEHCGCVHRKQAHEECEG
jgi:DNA-directed RNA polymerase subunit RPC12/RpoP